MLAGKAVVKGRKKLRKKTCVLMDSTGYSVGYSQRPYRIYKCRKKKYRLYQSKGYKPPKRRRYVKYAALIDRWTQLILSHVVRLGPSSDQPDFIPLLEDRPTFVRIKDVIADAGYDNERHHKYVVEQMKARCTIPPLQGVIRKHAGKSTTYRQKMLVRFPRKRYRQRAIAETFMSVIKRRTGWTSVSKRVDLRFKEALLRGGVYNIYRLIRIGSN